MLAALAPQMANFGGGQRNDLATRALITSLLAEPMDEEEPETQEEEPQVNSLAPMKAAHLPDNARLVIEEMCDKYGSRAKKRSRRAQEQRCRARYSSDRPGS